MVNWMFNFLAILIVFFTFTCNYREIENSSFTAGEECKELIDFYGEVNVNDGRCFIYIVAEEGVTVTTKPLR